MPWLAGKWEGRPIGSCSGRWAGVAFVQPPPRPGALLWSIAAGPLVNVILLPVTIVAFLFASRAGLGIEHRDFVHFLLSIAVINLVLLVFNMLPIYPLDGGQILQALALVRHRPGPKSDGGVDHRPRGSGRGDCAGARSP